MHTQSTPYRDVRVLTSLSEFKTIEIALSPKTDFYRTNLAIAAGLRHVNIEMQDLFPSSQRFVE
ncbi:MAG: hypothetical protein AAFX40_18435, partial [Cyanobacteria bacterium J06639_1]